MPRLNWLRRKERHHGSRASLEITSPLSIKQDVSNETAPTSMDHTAATSDLWGKAYRELRSSNKRLVDQFESILSSENVEDDGASPRKEQLSRMVERKLVLMEQTKWVINVAGRPVEVRKQVERLVKLVQMAKDSLSAVANMEPIHFGIPVAALCLLTSVSLKSLILR